MPDVTIVKLLFWQFRFNTKNMTMTWDWAVFLMLMEAINTVLWPLIFIVALRLTGINIDITAKTLAGVCIMLFSVRFFSRT